MTDSEFAQKVYEFVIRPKGSDPHMDVPAKGRRSRAAKPTVEEFTADDRVQLDLSKGPRYAAMCDEAYVFADAESVGSVNEYFFMKSQREHQLHLLESLEHIKLEISFLSEINRRDKFQPAKALADIASAYLSVSRIAEILDEAAPQSPESVPDSATSQRAWMNLKSYIDHAIAHHLETLNTKYRETFGLKQPDDINADPAGWTFRELISVCSLSERPGALADTRFMYKMLAVRLDEQVAQEQNMTRLGNLVSRKFRRYFVPPVISSLEMQIRDDHGHGRMNLPFTDLEISLEPLKKAIQIMQGFAFDPRLRPGDDEIADQLDPTGNRDLLTPACYESLGISREEFHKHTGSAPDAHLEIHSIELTPAEHEILCRVRTKRSDAEKLSAFQWDILRPALKGFEKYWLHCGGLSRATLSETAAGTKTATWAKLGQAKRTILEALHKQQKPNRCIGVAKLAGYKPTSLREHFKALQDLGYLLKVKGGYLITPKGIALVTSAL